MGPILLWAATLSPAMAAESGHIRGEVSDADGLPIPGATAVLSGPRIAGELRTQTDADGRFTLLAVPVGPHLLDVVFGGFQTTRVQVTVRLDESAFVPVVLRPSGGTTEIVVIHELPVIDATRSSVSTQIDDVMLQNLPVGRSYQDAVNMLPGVYGRVDTEEGGPGSGNPSVRGEGAYGNNILIDGISTRDPATKGFGTNINFDAIDQIQVYTDGAPAEFGQSTGMTVNVVTKAGGDEHHGSVGYYLGTDAAFGTYPILDLDLGAEVATTKRQFLSHELSLTAGGPVIKEKLWYFAALDLSASTVNFEGSLEDATGTTAPQVSQGLSGLAKLSWFVTPDIVLRYEVTGDFGTVNNVVDGSLYAPTAQAKQVDTAVGQIFTAEIRPDTKSQIEVKFSYLPTTVDVVPQVGDEEGLSFFNVENGKYTGNYDSYDLNTRSRLGGSATMTRLVDAFGEHRLKGGVEGWILSESRDLNYTGPGSGIQYFTAPSLGLTCDPPDFDNCFGYRTYIPSGKGGLKHDAHLMGVFLQDDWTAPSNDVTLNVGGRLDREVLFQNAGEKVIDQLMPAPRFGAAWNATSDSRTLVSMNMGRYFDLSGNSFSEWADTRSAYGYEEYAYNGESGGYDLVWTQDPTLDPLVYCTDASLDGYVNTLVAGGGTQKDADAARKTAESVCNGTLKPYHLDKVVVGIEREVVKRLAIGARAIYSQTRDLIEDINIDDSTWVIANTTAKLRDYKALEFTLERKWDEVWSALVSYTLSESVGHMPGQFELSSGGSFGSSGNDVGVYLDDVNDQAVRDAYMASGYGWVIDGLHGLGTVDDPAGYFGYLPYHSFHQVKINGFYQLPNGTTLGVVYEFDSGHAWQKRAYVPLYADYYAFPEGRGSRFMPPVHYVDVRAAHEFDLHNDRSVEFSVDIFNLPDFGAPITYYENDNSSFGLTMFRQEPRSARVGAKFTY